MADSFTDQVTKKKSLFILFRLSPPPPLPPAVTLLRYSFKTLVQIVTEW